MAEFNRLEIVKKFVKTATVAEVMQKDGIETRIAQAGRHTITAEKNIKSNKIISVSLDGTDAIGTPNPLNDRLATEVFDWIGTRSKELEKQKSKKQSFTDAKFKLATKKKPTSRIIRPDHNER